jgi:predicted phage tail protein
MVVDEPRLVAIPHALVADGRQMCFAEFMPRETLGSYLLRNGIVIGNNPVAVWHNGHRVPDDLWQRLIPRQGDLVVIRARAMGGGDSGKIIRSVALIALAIAAPYAGAAAASAAGLTAGTTGFAALSGAISAATIIAGSIVVNALIPLPKPAKASTVSASDDTSSDAYTIQAAQNSARQWGPMMLVFGYTKVVPDLASNPSTRYVGDQQYLLQSFHFGLQPDLIITNESIGDTPLYSYQGVTTQRSGWDGNLTLVYDNVDTLQGFDVNQYQGWLTRTTPTLTVDIEVEIAALLYNVDATTGAITPETVIIQIEYRPVGGSTWTPVGNYSNPIYADHYWAYGIYDFPGQDSTTAQWTQVSYGSLNYADHVDGEQHQECQTWGGGDAGDTTVCKTYEWRWLPHPFVLGRPWQGVAPDPLIGWDTEEGIQLTNADSRNPLRWTAGIQVPLGQYEVRIQKVSPDISASTASNLVSVTQIRAFQSTPTDYSGQLRYGISVLASSQINGAISDLSAMCQAICNVWDGASWVAQPTSNPAWWFLWFAIGRFDASGSRMYGGGIPEAQIDLDSIKAWGAYCDAKGWKFNYVLQQKMSVHDVLTMIARAGRASYSWQSGKLGVVWEAADQPAVAMIGPYNIKAGTFNVSYVGGNVDAIICNFINKDRDYQSDQIRVSVPGITQVLDNPQTFDLDGVDDSALVARHANLLAAQQNFMRRRVTWEMDIEGYIATRGDVVQISHDLTVWGYAGRLVGCDVVHDATTGERVSVTLILDRSVPIAGSGYLWLRSPDNQLVAVTVLGDGAVDRLVVAGLEPLANIPLPGDPVYGEVPAVDWAWQFDPAQTPGRRMKITSVTPTNDDGVQFEAYDNYPEYYLSETNPYAYTAPRDGTLLRAAAFSVSFQETIIDAKADLIQLRIDWVLSSPSNVYIAYSINGVTMPVLTVTDRYVTLSVHTGDVVVASVTPFGPTGLGTYRGAGWTVVGVLAPLPAVTGLTNVYRDTLTVLKWDAVSDVRDPDYEVRRGTTWDDSTTVLTTRDLETLAVGNGLYFVAARFVRSNGQTIYGPADSLEISGATLVRNVLQTIDEAPSWTGTLSESAFIFGNELTLVAQGDLLAADDVLSQDDWLWYGGVSSTGIYHTNTDNIVDIGYATPVRVDFQIESFALNFSENILGLADILASADILNASNQQHYKVQPQIRTAIDAGAWSEWTDYVPGLLNARYFDVRVVMQTDNPLIVPFVAAFSWTIDVPDLVQDAVDVSVPSSGAHIDFPKPFHAKPNIQVTQLDAVNGDRFTLTNVTLTGFDIYFFNNTTPKAAVMNYIAQRY